MKIKFLFILLLSFILFLPCSCYSNVNTMIKDYGSMYGIAETYDDSPEPGDLNFNEKEMLLPSYCNEVSSLLEIPAPTKCTSYKWKFTTVINNEEVEIKDIKCLSGYTLESNVLLIDNPKESGFKAGETYYLTLIVTGRKGGKITYKDRAIVIFYEDYLHINDY